LSPGISTTSFLEATEGVTKLFDLLGSSAFSVVKNDMEGNMKKIKERFLATPDKSSTLQDLVANEGKPGEKKRTATEGLMWLLRLVSIGNQELEGGKVVLEDERDRAKGA